MEGWRQPGARHGLGFSAGGGGNPFLPGASSLQPDDTWFGDPIASSSLPSQFAAQKRVAASSSTSLPSKAARLAGDPSGRLVFGQPNEGHASAPPFASAEGLGNVRQVPSAALEAGRLSFDEYMPAPPGHDDTFASEVWRITGVGAADYIRLFELQSHECHDLQVIQSKYRRLMRLLHPDKRRQDEEQQAGGKDRCDRAVRLVQEAMAKAKKDVQPDPEQDLKNEMRRMQEMKRQQARMAMQRQAEKSQAAPAVPDMDSLLSDISQVLGAGTSQAATTAPPTSTTTTELMDLLASMRQGQGQAVDLT